MWFMSQFVTSCGVVECAGNNPHLRVVVEILKLHFTVTLVKHSRNGAFVFLWMAIFIKIAIIKCRKLHPKTHWVTVQHGNHHRYVYVWRTPLRNVWMAHGVSRSQVCSHRRTTLRPQGLTLEISSTLFTSDFTRWLPSEKSADTQLEPSK